MTTITLDTKKINDGSYCYCKSARQLIGRNIVTASVTSRAPTRVAAVTEVRHSTTNAGCWLVLDGHWLTPLRTLTIRRLDVEVTNDTPDVEVHARAPFPARTGTLTFDDATEIVRDAWARHQDMTAAVPIRRSAAPTVRRAFLPDPPQVPESLRSYYTQGRVRRVPATGRWAADLGYAGSTRPLGEYDTIGEAQAVVEAAHGKAWDTLESWLRQYVPGDWVLARLPLDVDVEDRLSIADVARALGVTEGTVRGYRSRGQMPAADSPAGARSPWWDRSTITGWVRGGQGARTDLRT